MKIPFNKPHLTGKETHYIYDAVQTGKISGNGKYTKLAQEFFTKKYGFNKCLLTTSCTDALEMAAILIDIQEGDEVIMPSYTFVSTANAFLLRGAKIVFCDSREDHPGMDEKKVEELISDKTKAIVTVHYAGVASNMRLLKEIADKHNVILIEDAAQAIESKFIEYKEKGVYLGGIGHLSAFSFHETKNIISGEGGMLVINDDRFTERAEIIWEKGTNRAAFFRGEVDKYGWVDIGSSFLPSELVAAFLYAQLEEIENIQKRRILLWEKYDRELKVWAKKNKVHLPSAPEFAVNNGHMFYMVCPTAYFRTKLIEHLKENDILAVFHYQSLHQSKYFEGRHDGRELPNSDRYTDCLVRLPLFYDLKKEEIDHVIDSINNFKS